MFSHRIFFLTILSGYFFFSNLIFSNTILEHPDEHVLNNTSSLTIHTTNPQPLIITSCFAGNEPRPLSSTTASYTITSDAHKTCKISAFLNNRMPQNTSLAIQLAAPSGAQSTGMIMLSTIPQNLVLHIPPHTNATLPITYLFSTKCQAGILPLTTKMVTFTLDTE
ncbi:MAG: hypothetical protein P4L16_06335 [Chlamydiales bacterium]|nr:hypothetical protein [Chlamydiales bacterium]